MKKHKNKMEWSEAASCLYQVWKKKGCRELMIPFMDMDRGKSRHYTMRITVDAGATTEEMTQDMLQYIWSL
jgi:hypothetical protein